MFQRRQKISLLHRIVQFFWPKAGWHRSTRYVFHRVARIPGSAYSLAAGFACGAAISFTPFMGLHFVISMAMAYVIRANVLAAAIGTAVGNPWTFPFIWVGVFNTGQWILRTNSMDAQEIDFLDVLTESMEALHKLDFDYLVEVGGPVILPMLVGCVPWVIGVWIVFYLPLRPVISKYQAARHHKRTQKLHAQNTDERQEKA
ncbi:MAG: DUF2062 domain-containing protein [Magnetovibrio sp.]|nr:DUF2062 domain-containing protein [Magnetovibrio sp.]